MNNDLNFKRLESIMIESLLDEDKKITLPSDWKDRKFNLNYNTHTRALIRHFAYHLQLEILKEGGHTNEPSDTGPMQQV